jgi:hypothetical protein
LILAGKRLTRGRILLVVSEEVVVISLMKLAGKCGNTGMIRLDDGKWIRARDTCLFRAYLNF